MEKTITSRKEDDELRCPHCDGGGLSVKRIHICHPSDEMLVTFGTDPLCLDEIDGGDSEGYVTLTVDCPHCSPQGDRFYLHIEDGKTRVRDFVARTHWSTDRAGDPNSASNRIPKALVDAGENPRAWPASCPAGGGWSDAKARRGVVRRAGALAW